MPKFIQTKLGRLLEKGVGDPVLRETVIRYWILNPMSSTREIADALRCSHSFVWKVTSIRSKSTATEKVGRKVGYRKLSSTERHLVGSLLDEIQCTSIKQLRAEFAKRSDGVDLPVNDATLRRFLKNDLKAHKNQGEYVHPNKWKPENVEYYGRFLFFQIVQCRGGAVWLGVRERSADRKKQ